MRRRRLVGRCGGWVRDRVRDRVRRNVRSRHATMYERWRRVRRVHGLVGVVGRIHVRRRLAVKRLHQVHGSGGIHGLRPRIRHLHGVRRRALERRHGDDRHARVWQHAGMHVDADTGCELGRVRRKRRSAVRVVVLLVVVVLLRMTGARVSRRLLRLRCRLRLRWWQLCRRQCRVDCDRDQLHVPDESNRGFLTRDGRLG